MICLFLKTAWKGSSPLLADANLEKTKKSCDIIKAIGSIHNASTEDQLSILEHLDKTGVVLQDFDIYNLLRTCSDQQNLVAGKCLVSLIFCNRSNAISLFGDQLIRFFAGCGCVEDAYAVFCKVVRPTTYTWNAIISAYANLGKGEMALALYVRMQKTGVGANEFIFSTVLKTCTGLGLLHQGKIIHDQMLRCGIRIDLASGNALLDMYSKHGEVGAAHKMFDSLPNTDVVSWTTMIAGYVQLGLDITALQWFSQMQGKGILPNRVTLLCIVKACGAAGLLLQGRIIHDQIMRNSFDIGISIINVLIDFYAKCKSLKEAELLFNNLPKRDAVSWGALMSGYAQHGHDHLVFTCFNEILSKGIQPNEFIYLCVIKVASNLEARREGQEIHDILLRVKVECNREIGNALVGMYSKCGCLDEAYAVLVKVKEKTDVSWGVIISGYTQHGDGDRAIELFYSMQSDGYEPNKFILSCVLKACGSIGNLRYGKLIHFRTVTSSLESDTAVGNALVDMYAKCGSVFEAHKVFDKLPFRDTITWGAMISGYTQNGFGTYAINLFEKMQEEGICANEIILSSILKGCGSMKAASQGERFYDLIMMAGYDSNIVIANTIIAMYIQCQYLAEAQRVFDVLPSRDEVSWGTILTGYAECGLHLQALRLFGRMIKEGFKANEVVFLGALRACACIGAFRQGKLVHDHVVQSGLDSDKIISSTLVDMYSKCGSLQDTHNVFDGMNVRDGVTWGIMSAACAHHGKWELSRKYLEGMQQKGLEMPSILYSSMLSAFSHVGHLRNGQGDLQSITTENALFYCNEHGNCMIDMLGRVGLLEEAKSMLRTTPSPDAIGYTSVLAACKTYGDVELGRACLDKVTWLSLNAAAGYALMSSMYSELHLLGEVSSIQDLRSCLSAWKKPGLAWIDVNDTLQEFCVGDQANSRYESLCLLLKRLLGASKVEGFVPNLNHSVGSDRKLEDVLEHKILSLCPHGLKMKSLPNLLSGIPNRSCFVGVCLVDTICIMCILGPHVYGWLCVCTDAYICIYMPICLNV